jgi:guanylate kinase
MFYGTLKSELTRIWGEGKTVIFDVDVIGGIHLKKIMLDNALSIFIQPPSMEELERRLTTRNTDSIEKINMRLAKAKQEIEQANDFDVIVVNDRLDLAIETVHSAISRFI